MEYWGICQDEQLRFVIDVDDNRSWVDELLP
jgi:hypothetical protein